MPTKATPSDLELLAAAELASRAAHAPYSDFPVGAAIRASDEQIFSGCNVENAAYPEGTCAEAGAIAAMVLAGEKRIKAIAVFAGNSGGKLCTPCGGCRQKIAEFASDNTRIIVATPDGGGSVYSIGELLPERFSPESL